MAETPKTVKITLAVDATQWTAALAELRALLEECGTDIPAEDVDTSRAKFKAAVTHRKDTNA
jgi:hypothetical protein